jgi:hypothetical protein
MPQQPDNLAIFRKDYDRLIDRLAIGITDEVLLEAQYNRRSQGIDKSVDDDKQPLERIVEPITRINNQELAETMAYAGKAERDTAAYTRRITRAQYASAKDLYLISNNQNFYDKTLWQRLKTRVALNKSSNHRLRSMEFGYYKVPPQISIPGRMALSRVIDTYKYENKDLNKNYLDSNFIMAYVNHNQTAIYNSGKVAQSRLRIAEAKDQQAEAKEELAQLLYVKPFSQEFMDKHPGISFDLDNLYELIRCVKDQKGLKQNEGFIEPTKVELNGLDTLTDLHQAISINKGTVEQLISTNPRYLGAEHDLSVVDKLLSSKETTISNLMDLNNNLQKLYNTLLQVMVDERKLVVANIKNGSPNADDKLIIEL